MEYLSASTQIADAYRAGCEIGKKLKDINPEVIIVFVTINYSENIDELLLGLRDEAGNEVIICGGTSDGIFERDSVSHYGVCALGIASAGKTKWSAAIESGLGNSTNLAAQRAATSAIEALGTAPEFTFVMADGITADGRDLTLGIQQVIRTPFFGCLAADDRKFSRSIVFLQDKIMDDAVFVLMGSAPLPYMLNAASGWKPFGDAGEITAADNTTLKLINGKPAEQFMRDQAGKEFSTFDFGTMPLAEYHSGLNGYYVLRTVAKSDPETGELILFGSLRQGAFVRVCSAGTQEIIDAVKQALQSLQLSKIKPAACIIISCAGRKWLLPNDGAEEIAQVKNILGNIPLIGIASYGEISPFLLGPGHYSPVLFHNVTFVICVLGN